jgi:hypothetical protein
MDYREAQNMLNIVWNKASNEHAELKVKDFTFKVKDLHTNVPLRGQCVKVKVA